MTRCSSGDIYTTTSFRKRVSSTTIFRIKRKNEPVPIAKNASSKARKAIQTHTDVVMPEWRAKILAVGMTTHANIVV